MLTRALRKGEQENKLGTDWVYTPPAGGYTNSTSDVAIKAAAGAGIRNYITSMQIGAGVALATASELVIKSASTIIWRMSLPAAVIAPINIIFDPPLVSAANEALNIAAVTQFATGNLSVNARGYAV